jgi:DNA-binding transcriptional regulator YdaS (Cro superfamily)
MTDARSRDAVTVAENYLDGQATIEELKRALNWTKCAEGKAYSRYSACRVPSAFVSRFAALTAYLAVEYVVGIAEHSNDVSYAANVAYFAERVAYHAAIAADPNVNAAHIATEKWQCDHLRELIPWTEVKELIADYEGENSCE